MGGPTLFLMTQKAFAYTFLLFIILNSPLFFYYSTGGKGRQSGLEEQQADSSQATDIFGKLSLGNLGVSDYTCSNLNIAKVGYSSFDKKQLQFVCPYGTMRLLTQY